MSMTSKVNSTLRQAIIAALTTTEAKSNQAIREVVNGCTGTTSLRAIQEATQKLTKEGVLVSAGRGFYALSTSYTNNTLTQSAVASN